MAYSRIGKTQKAIGVFVRALSLSPQDPGIHSYLGHLYSEVGQWQMAENQYREAISLRKDFSEAYHFLADMYLDLARKHEDTSRYEQAINTYREAIENNVSVSGSYSNIGVIYRELGRQQESLESFEEALKYAPEGVVGLHNLGTVYLEAGRFADAIPVWQKLVDVLKNDPEPKEFFLAQTYHNLGASILGADSLREQEHGTSDPALLQEAERVFKETLEIDPGYTYSYVGMGIIFCRQGRFDEAKEFFLTALELDPNNEVVSDNLQLMYLDEILKPLRNHAAAVKLDDSLVIEELAVKIAVTQQQALEEQEKNPQPYKVFTTERLLRVLLPVIKKMNPAARFLIGAKLFERNLLPSEMAARLAGVDRVSFLLGLQNAGGAQPDSTDGHIHHEDLHPSTADVEGVANLFLRDHLPDRFMATNPSLDESANLWRVSVVLSYPGIGPVGEVGEILVSGADEKVLSHTLFEEMRAKALKLYEQHRDAIEAPVL